ncbi:MAG: hydroxymyristoyl-ACP dehydratase, partial [Rikenellaceae bacterium]
MGVFEKAIISSEEIIEFIPQRAPIIMVDEFFGVEDNISRSGLTIDKDNIFCEEELFSECGVIEHIAQSAAMRMGYIYKSNNKNVPLGYIGSVNKFKIYSLPKVGEKLRTEITIEQEVMNISL